MKIFILQFLIVVYYTRKYFFFFFFIFFYSFYFYIYFFFLFAMLFSQFYSFFKLYFFFFVCIYIYIYIFFLLLYVYFLLCSTRNFSFLFFTPSFPLFSLSILSSHFFFFHVHLTVFSVFPTYFHPRLTLTLFISLKYIFFTKKNSHQQEFFAFRAKTFTLFLSFILPPPSHSHFPTTPLSHPHVISINFHSIEKHARPLSPLTFH